jgi:pimeloyl-ACP methyl ester carboxylesterase
MSRTHTTSPSSPASLPLLSWAFDTQEGFTLRGWHSPPSGKPVLHFLHGNSFCGRVYEPMLALLSADFDLWLSDVQGHGDSDLGGRFKGWNLSAELAVQAFQAHRKSLFGDVAVVGLGHSFGGVLTCLIMAEHPKLFSRSVVLDPVIFSAAMALGITMAEATGLAAHSPLARAARKRRSHWPDRQAAIEALRGRGTYKGWAEEALQAFGEHALRPADDGEGVVLKCPPSREAEIFASAPVGLWASLRRIKTPTTLIHADKTFPFIAPSAEQWAASNSHVKVEVVHGGHCFMQVDPTATAALVRSHLL